jgi:hypothetical protein
VSTRGEGHASRKEKFLAFWSLRIGNDAAELRWAWANSLNLSYALNFVSLPCIFAGAWAHISLLVTFGVIVYIVQGCIFIVAVRRLRASNRAASIALGVRIGMRGTPGPPRSAVAYEKWRKKYGIPDDVPMAKSVD